MRAYSRRRKSEKQGPAARKKASNNVRKIRTEKMMSKAELARRAGMSTLTIDRVERGLPCRMDTKRKILEALGSQAVGPGARLRRGRLTQRRGHRRGAADLDEHGRTAR